MMSDVEKIPLNQAKLHVGQLTQHEQSMFEKAHPDEKDISHDFATVRVNDELIGQYIEDPKLKIGYENYETKEIEKMRENYDPNTRLIIEEGRRLKKLF